MKIGLVSRRESRATRKAYTLVELLVVVALLSILFVATYGGITFGFATTQDSRENLRATQIIIERMEGLALQLGPVGL